MHVRVRAAVFFTIMFAACGGRTGVAPTPAPTLLGRVSHAMTYDPVHQRVLLYGGRGPSVAGGADTEQRDLWAWDGATWSLVDAGTNGPAARNTAGLAFAGTTGHVVVVGGRTGTAPNSPAFDDTWEWDGSAWSAGIGPSPGRRIHFALAYDVARGRLVLYGGFDPTAQTESHDLWERSAGTWAATGVTGPSASFAPAAVDDGPTALCWIFVSSTSDRTISVYSWDGVTLQLLSSAGPRLTGYAAAPLGTGTGALLFGGSDGTSILADTWRWDGASWTRLSPATSPPARVSAAMAFDGARGRMVLYGGETASATLGDTWEFDGATWARR
jgi:Galactose oxidase, central domain